MLLLPVSLNLNLSVCVVPATWSFCVGVVVPMPTLPSVSIVTLSSPTLAS